MKKKKAAVIDDDPLDHEIDFSNARPNPFAMDFYKSRNLRILAPDLLELYPDSHSMNEALRMLANVAKRYAAKEREGVQVKISARTATAHTAPKSAKKKVRS